MRASIAATEAAVLLLCVHGSAQAADPQVPEHGQLTVNAGAGVSSGHLLDPHAEGEGPAVYGGVELQVRVRRPLGIGVLFGGSNVTGSFFGANVRAEAHVSPHVFLSAGAGPTVAASGRMAGLLMVGWDAGVSVRFTTNFALTFGPMMAFAINHRGTPGCGVDTCNAWAAPGDTLFLLRAGFGAAF